MLGVILKKKPFADPSDQRLQISLQCALIALTAVGILCLYGVLDDGVATVLVVSIFVVKVAAVTVAVAVAYRTERRRLRRRADDDERDDDDRSSWDRAISQALFS